MELHDSWYRICPQNSRITVSPMTNPVKVEWSLILSSVIKQADSTQDENKKDTHLLTTTKSRAKAYIRIHQHNWNFTRYVAIYLYLGKAACDTFELKSSCKLQFPSSLHFLPLFLLGFPLTVDLPPKKTCRWSIIGHVFGVHGKSKVSLRGTGLQNLARSTSTLEVWICWPWRFGFLFSSLRIPDIC